MKRINKKIFVFFATGIIISGIFFINYAEALVNPVGRLYYGNSTNTVLNFRTNTYDFGFGAAQTFTHGASASLIRFVVAKPAVTRDEIMVGFLKADGQLTVVKGINGFDVNTDYATAWSNTGTTPAMTCEGTKADCSRAFDIGYERLSGRAMVVYADTTNQKLYYALWNGTAWSPNATPGTPGATNEIALSSNGRPTFVSLKPKGGSNEIIMAVGIDVGGVMEVEAYRWTGSAWTDQNVVTATTNASTQGLNQGAVFDVEWEDSTGDAIVVYATAATVEMKYKLLPSGGTWGTETDAFDTPVNGSGVIWVNTEGDPSSNRIAVATNDTANDLSVAVWKADGTTAGWTNFSSTINEITLEGSNGTTAGPAYTDLLWERTGSEFIVVAQNAGAGDTGEYTRLTCTGTGCTVTTAITVITTTAGTDDAQFNRLAGSRNSDDIMYIQSDIDNNLFLQHWNGTAWEAGDSGVMDASASICSADNIATGCVDMPAVFTYLRYSPWSRNWRWYAGTDTTDTPTTALAVENATSTGIDGYNQQLRLRFNMAETGGQGQTDARKKLQYTTASPYTETASWTDVDNSAGAGIWRYFDCNGGTATCNDGQTTVANVLTGSTGTGWWTGSKDAVAGASMDHATSTTMEIEFPIEGNNTATGTTYYFRMYDVDQVSAVRRFQDSGNTTSCAGSTGCEYPELKTATSTYNQEAFRFFANVDSTDVGAALAAQDTAAALTSTGQAFRLRILNHVAVAGLGTSQGDFKLQFAAKGAGTCAAPTGSYADVTTGTVISFNDNATPTDGSALTANASDPDAGHTVVVQSYEELNNFTNPNAIPSGQDGKWDFSLYDNAAPGATAYCFRMVPVNSSNNSTVTYTQYPQITTVASQPAINQLHYRWRNDDGSESGASYSAAEDTSLTSDVFVGDRKRLRILLSNTGSGSASNYTYKLEHASTTCTLWLPVPTTSTLVGEHWVMDASSNVSDGAVTTDSSGLTNPAGSFVVGQVKTTGNQTTAHTLAGGNTEFTEMEYSVKSTANSVAGVTYCFRTTNAGSTTNFTYTVQPQVVISGQARAVVGGGGSESSGGGAPQTGGTAPGGGGTEPGGGGTPVDGGTPSGGGGDSGYLYIKSNLASIGTLEIGSFVKHILAFLWK